MISRKHLGNLLRAIGLPGILLALSLTMTGCESSEGPMEEAGEEVDQAMEEAADKTDQVMDEAADEVEQAADEVEESVQ
jgi:hypothetical protein